MKKILAIVLSFTFILTLAGCQNPSTTDDSGSSQEETTTDPSSATQEYPSWRPEEVTVSDPDGDDDLTSKSGIISEGRIYIIQGQVLLVSGKNSPMWLYPDVKNMFHGFSTGDLVRVNHGMKMETYPMQTYTSQIALLEDGDVSDITDEMWSVIDGFIVDAPRE